MMSISNYAFENRIFSCKESGRISGDDAKTWAEKLREHATQSPTPIVALVDALEVRQVSRAALEIFAKASYTPNVLAVVVATNAPVEVTATNIGLLGKPHQTLVFSTLAAAQEQAQKLLEAEKT